MPSAGRVTSTWLDGRTPHGVAYTLLVGTVNTIFRMQSLDASLTSEGERATLTCESDAETLLRAGGVLREHGYVLHHINDYTLPDVRA